MNFQIKLVLEKYLADNEEEIILDYIDQGPSFVKSKMGISEDEWKVVFDYLVFDCDLLFRTVGRSLDFFVNEYLSCGAEHVREILDISAESYDFVWKQILQLLLETYCKKNFAEINFERSLNAFVHVLNCARSHRLI